MKDSRPFASRPIAVSYPTRESRHPTIGHIMCVQCGDRRVMKQLREMPFAVDQCRRCGQRWTYDTMADKAARYNAAIADAEGKELLSDTGEAKV